MGRIKSLMIKKAARQLIDGEHKINESYENNKKILGHDMPSKSTRNKIAGYIARLIRMKNNPRQKRIRAPEETRQSQYQY